MPLLEVLEPSSPGRASARACQSGSGPGGYRRDRDTVVSVTSTSSGGGAAWSTEGDTSGTSTGILVTSAKLSCSSRNPALTICSPPTVVHPSWMSHGRSGSRWSQARPGSPAQTHTSPCSSRTG